MTDALVALGQQLRSADRRSTWLADPVAFARDCVVWPTDSGLTGYQAAVLAGLARNRRMAVKIAPRSRKDSHNGAERALVRNHPRSGRAGLEGCYNSRGLVTARALPAAGNPPVEPSPALGRHWAPGLRPPDRAVDPQPQAEPWPSLRRRL